MGTWDYWSKVRLAERTLAISSAWDQQIRQACYIISENFQCKLLSNVGNHLQKHRDGFQDSFGPSAQNLLNIEVINAMAPIREQCRLAGKVSEFRFSRRSCELLGAVLAVELALVEGLLVEDNFLQLTIERACLVLIYGWRDSRLSFRPRLASLPPRKCRTLFLRSLDSYSAVWSRQ